MILFDGIVWYEVDQWANRLSFCRLGVYRAADPDGETVTVVIATDLADNPGPSVTNSAEAWATEAVRAFALDPHRTRFVEHYDHWSELVVSTETETWDRVEFVWSADRRTQTPRWRRVTKHDVEALIGETFVARA